jgi:hypothetical protein
MRLMILSKADVAPRHCYLTTFSLHLQRCRDRVAAAQVQVKRRRGGAWSSYSTSEAIATNPVARPGRARTPTQGKRMLRTRSIESRLGQIQGGEGCGPWESTYPIRCQPTLARINMPMMTRALETMPRNAARGTAWASLAPNQEPPLRLTARMMLKAKSSLP